MGGPDAEDAAAGLGLRGGQRRGRIAGGKPVGPGPRQPAVGSEATLLRPGAETRMTSGEPMVRLSGEADPPPRVACDMAVEFQFDERELHGGGLGAGRPHQLVDADGRHGEQRHDGFEQILGRRRA